MSILGKFLDTIAPGLGSAHDAKKAAQRDLPIEGGAGMGMSGMQLPAMPDPTMHVDDAGASPQQEAQARANGFRSYDEMLNWARRRTEQHTGTIGQGRQSAFDQIKGALHGGGGADVVGNIPGHPATVFNRITDTLRNALGHE